MFDGSYVVAGCLTGFVVGLTGVGGGALMMPILIYIFDSAPITAVATDLWFACITKLVCARIYMKSNMVDWQIVRRMLMGSIPVSLIIIFMINLGFLIEKVQLLNKIIGIMILITGISLFLAPKLMKISHERRLKEPHSFKRFQSELTVLGGGILGLCVSLTSVGAGALGSTLLAFLYPLRMTPHRLVATDIVQAIPLAAIAGIGYLLLGLVDLHVLANLLLGSIPAAFIGALLAKRVNGRKIQISLAFMLLVIGLKSVFS